MLAAKGGPFPIWITFRESAFRPGNVYAWGGRLQLARNASAHKSLPCFPNGAIVHDTVDRGKRTMIRAAGLICSWRPYPELRARAASALLEGARPSALQPVGCYHQCGAALSKPKSYAVEAQVPQGLGHASCAYQASIVMRPLPVRWPAFTGYHYYYFLRPSRSCPQSPREGGLGRYARERPLLFFEEGKQTYFLTVPLGLACTWCIQRVHSRSQRVNLWNFFPVFVRS